MVRFFCDGAPLDDDPSNSLRSSWFRPSIFSLIDERGGGAAGEMGEAAARLASEYKVHTPAAYFNRDAVSAING